MSAPAPERAVLVTGAARGLGRALALHLAGAGTHLLLHYHASEDPAREAEREAARRGSRVTLLRADLALPADRERLMDEVVAAVPALHVLVNNAAVYPEARLEEITPEAWSRLLELNCSAVFHLTRRAEPLLAAAAKPGSPACVINVGDSGADRVIARPVATPYHVAKLGVHVLTRSFAKALGPQVRVNMVSPGFLDESVGESPAGVPAGRLGTHADVLAAVDYLLSPAAAYVSGANLVVSGGWNL